jgi:hypothetical protein
MKRLALLTLLLLVACGGRLPNDATCRNSPWDSFDSDSPENPFENAVWANMIVSVTPDSLPVRVTSRLGVVKARETLQADGTRRIRYNMGYHVPGRITVEVIDRGEPVHTIPIDIDSTARRTYTVSITCD